MAQQSQTMINIAQIPSRCAIRSGALSRKISTQLYQSMVVIAHIIHSPISIIFRVTAYYY